MNDQSNSNSKILGQVFDVRFHPGFDVIAPGLNTKTKAWEEFAGSLDLLVECWAIIEEFADQAYTPDESEAFIMSGAMNRYRGTVPRSWLKILNDLRRKTKGQKSGGVTRARIA